MLIKSKYQFIYKIISIKTGNKFEILFCGLVDK